MPLYLLRYNQSEHHKEDQDGKNLCDDHKNASNSIDISGQIWPQKSAAYPLACCIVSNINRIRHRPTLTLDIADNKAPADTTQDFLITIFQCGPKPASGM